MMGGRLREKRISYRGMVIRSPDRRERFERASATKQTEYSLVMRPERSDSESVTRQGFVMQIRRVGGVWSFGDHLFWAWVFIFYFFDLFQD